MTDPEKFNLDNYSDDSLTGCLLEVALDYPGELKDLDNDYPLAAGKYKSDKKILSYEKLQIIEDKTFSLGKNKKLIPILDSKRTYMLHYQNLKLKLKLKKKINGVLEFKQSPSIKPHIEQNTELQREAEKEGNKIKNQNAKLRNNSIFGKSINIQ